MSKHRDPVATERAATGKKRVVTNPFYERIVRDGYSTPGSDGARIEFYPVRLPSALQAEFDARAAREGLTRREVVERGGAVERAVLAWMRS